MPDDPHPELPPSPDERGEPVPQRTRPDDLVRKQPLALESRPRPTIPDDLHSPRSKLVYLFLVTVGQATPMELSDALREPLLSLYQVLKTLLRRGLVELRGERYVPARVDTV